MLRYQVGRNVDMTLAAICNVLRYLKPRVAALPISPPAYFHVDVPL